MPRPVPTPDENVKASHLPRKPHRLVAAWIEEDRRSRATARQYGWPESESREITKRVLCTYDALFKAAEKRGYKVEHEARYLRPVWLIIANERIDINVRERLHHRRERLTEDELKDPTNVALNRRWKQTRERAGTLLLEVSAAYRSIGKRRWEDTAEVLLEDRIDTILPEIEQIAALAVAKRQEADEWHRRWEEERDRKERRAALIERADRRWDLARKAAADWKEAETMRSFLNAVAARFEDHPSRRAAAWLKWARARADEMDPMTGSKQELVSTLMAPAWKREPDDEEPD